MNHNKLGHGLLILASLLTTSFAQDEANGTDAQWEQKYEKLLAARPDIKSKLANGDATKEHIIQWLKEGGDKQNTNTKFAGARKVEVLAPTGFGTEGEKRVYSGPQPGEPLPSFTAMSLFGELAGQEFDPIARAAGKPLLLIFQDSGVVGLKGLFLNAPLLARIAEKSPKGLYLCSCILTDDVNDRSMFNASFVQGFKQVFEMCIFAEGRDGPGAYGLNRNVAMTVIVAKDGKVLHNFVFPQPLLYPDPHILGAIAEAIEVDRDTMKSWVSETKATTYQK